MRSSSASMAANRQQETYIRARDNPFFDGMRRGEAEIMDKGSNFNLNEKIAGESIMRTASDVSSRRSRKITSEVLENPSSPLKTSPSDIILEHYGRSASSTWSRISEATSSPLSEHQSALKFGVEDVNESQKEHPPKSSQANEVTQTLALTKPMIEQSYSVNKDRTNLSKVPLPPSAALFYNGYSPQMEVVESCQSIYKLNMYLRARKDDVNAGVPGRFLHAVIGPDICDVGSVASTIMYAFYLNESLQNKLFCTVPIINMTRADMESRAELKWLLDACHVDQSSLVFLDELIDLSYYDLFGSLKLVLLNCNKLPARQEALKEALVEIFSCSKHDDGYSWVKNATFGEEASCSTLIAEKFLLTTPEILAGQRFSRLLLAGILMDTGNLRSPLSTSKDNYMATLLINGAGRYGCNGLYQILRYKMYDVPELSIGEILQKDIKKWTKIGKLISGNSRLTVLNIGMSSIGISIAQLLSLDSTSNLEISHFQRLEKLSLLLIVSGYHDAEKNFKREILVSAESVELLKNLIQFMKSSAPDLPLKILHHPDLREEMKAFEVDRVTSRKTIERLLEEYIEVSN